MITLKVDLIDTTRPWTADSRGWVSQESWIRPLQHRALQGMAFGDGVRFCVAVREVGHDDAQDLSILPRTDLSPGTYQAQLGSIASYPLDMILVEMEPGRVRVKAGVHGMVPLYLTAGRTKLHGSWDITELRAHMSADRLNERQVARMLLHEDRYCKATIFGGIFQLTERSHANFDSAGLRLHYPQPAQHFLPRTLAPDADVITGFERVLYKVTERRPIDPVRTAIQLSGGQDSANVAMTLAARFPAQLTSCAMILPGPAGVQQKRRRHALIKHCGFTDIAVLVMDHLPLKPSGPRQATWLAASPMDEPYIEANIALLKALARANIDVLYTGFGGDEVMGVRRWERSDREPPPKPPTWLGERTRALEPTLDDDLAPLSVVPESTLMALAAASPAIARAGFWPVSPFADPALVRFGEWLPLSWRRAKRLLRDRLLCLGLPTEVAYPALRENFSGVMSAAIHRYGTAMLTGDAANGKLVESGFVDRDKLLAATKMASVSPKDADPRLYIVAALESALRQITGT